MTPEDKWIQQLQSPNTDKRYEACEQLRIMDSLSMEARSALEQATHDPVQWVAEVAQHALTVHSNSETKIPTTPPASKPISVLRLLGWGVLIIVACLVVQLVIGYLVLVVCYHSSC